MHVRHRRGQSDPCPPALEPKQPSQLVWLIVHLGLGLVWIGLIATGAEGGTGTSASGSQVLVMLLLAGWLPTLPLACWQVRHRRWRALVASDLLAAGLLVVLVITAYLPLFFFHVAWFLPLTLLPRGLLTELMWRWLSHHRA